MPAPAIPPARAFRGEGCGPVVTDAVRRGAKGGAPNGGASDGAASHSGASRGGASDGGGSAIPGYKDWPAHAGAAAPFRAADASVQALADVLGLRLRPVPPPVHRGATVLQSGVAITPLRWRMPYGPPTIAWELRPAEHGTTAGHGAHDGHDRAGSDRRASQPGELLPGILALHPHGGSRSIGAAQLIDFHGENAGATANRLARAGFTVLAHDSFSWASRRFELSTLPPKLARTRDALLALWAEEGHAPSDDELFDAVSNAHEDLIAKTAGALGQTFAGMVVADDLVALDVLTGLPGVDASRIATFGFSGGGGRAHLAGALDERVGAVVIAGMMATFASLMPRYIETHSWLLHTPGLPQLCDWPDVALIGAPRELLVLYGERDPLFPPKGMAAAHRSLSRLAHYSGHFFDAGHELSEPMMQAATEFLLAWRDRRDLKPTAS